MYLQRKVNFSVFFKILIICFFIVDVVVTVSVFVASDQATAKIVKKI